MKNLRTAILVAGLALMAGCGTFGNGKIDNPLLATPYQAGRTFVFVDVVTSPVQPDEMANVVDLVYGMANMQLTGNSLADEFIKAQIDVYYADATPEFRQVVFNLYKNLTIKLVDQVNANPELPDLAVLDDFNRGIRDALALYRPDEIYKAKAAVEDQ